MHKPSNNYLKYSLIAIFLFLNTCFAYSQLIVYKQYSNPEVENSDEYKNGNIYQKDILLYIDLLKTTHPGFAPGVEQAFNIDSVGKEAYLWGVACQSDIELSFYLQKIITPLYDGHTGVKFNIDENSLFYPFSFFKEDEKVYIKLVPKESTEHLGKQISQINGSPVIEVIDSFKNTISYENDNYFYSKASNYMQPLYFWLYNKHHRQDSILELTFTDNSRMNLYPMQMNKIQCDQITAKTQANEIARVNNKLPFQYKLLPEKSICYLYFDQCIDQSTMRYMQIMRNTTTTEDVEKQISKTPRFDEFLAEMFQSIADNEIKTLVIDVKDNGGGNSRLCDILLSWLKPVKDMKEGSAAIRFSHLFEMQYPEQSKIYKERLEKVNQFELGNLYNSKWLDSIGVDDPLKTELELKLDSLFIMNKDESKIFKGNIIFIQGEDTYSSAGSLILDAVDNNIGIVIGEKGTYRPCNYGDILGWELPNTKLQGFISHKYFIRPDQSKCGENAIVPKVEITMTWKDKTEENNPYWEWIVNNYVNK